MNVKANGEDKDSTRRGTSEGVPGQSGPEGGWTSAGAVFRAGAQGLKNSGVKPNWRDGA